MLRRTIFTCGLARRKRPKILLPAMMVRWLTPAPKRPSATSGRSACESVTSGTIAAKSVAPNQGAP